MERVTRDFLIHGDFMDCSADGALRLRPGAWAACLGGNCAGVYDAPPAEYAQLPSLDFSGRLIVPGFVDLHLHASQYENLGLGMDYELLPWLEELTFPVEARFSDADQARTRYQAFAGALRRSATTRAVCFATIHSEAALLLMEALEETGLITLVGKVNMDANSPDYIRESTEGTQAATLAWLEASLDRFIRTKPILTPRFAPSCTTDTLAFLGHVARDSSLPIQSHLSENLEEIAWVHALHPDCRDYASVYEKYGLLGEQTIMAHCVHCTEEETAILQERKVMVAHCPTSNTNVRSGIAPIRRYMQKGLRVGLGSDISGGHTLDMIAVARSAVDVSKLRWRLTGEDDGYLSAPDAFFLATRGGGAFFGQAGAFEPGFAFDALVLDDSGWAQGERDLRRRFEKFLYLGHMGAIQAKFVAGNRLF